MCLSLGGEFANVGANGARGVRVPEAEVTGYSELPHIGTGTQTPALCMAENTLAHLAISPTPLSIYLNMYGTVQEFVKLC